MYKKTKPAGLMLLVGISIALLVAGAVSADHVHATADIRGCEDAAISGSGPYRVAFIRGHQTCRCEHPDKRTVAR